LCLVALPALVAAQATDRSVWLEGKLFPLGGARSEMLYHWTFHQDPLGTWRTRYIAPAGTVAAEDELVWEGDAPVAYRYTRTVAGEVEVSSVERHGTQLVFSMRRGAKQRSAEQAVAGLFAVGPSLVLLVRTHWVQLTAGEHLSVQYGVLDQLRTFTFDVFRVFSEAPPGGAGETVIRMRIANHFLQLFIDPIDLVFSPSGDVLREIRGRALPVGNRGGAPAAVNAALVITNPQPIPR
jgi:hypothetical protein